MAPLIKASKVGEKVLVYFHTNEEDNEFLNLDRWHWCEVVRRYKEPRPPRLSKCPCGSNNQYWYCCGKHRARPQILLDVRHPVSGRICRGKLAFMTYRTEREFLEDLNEEAQVMWRLKPWRRLETAVDSQ